MLLYYYYKPIFNMSLTRTAASCETMGGSLIHLCAELNLEAISGLVHSGHLGKKMKCFHI